MSEDLVSRWRVERIRSTFDWVFRDKKTGRVVIAQFPNLSLGIFLVASLVRHLDHLTGTPGDLLEVVVAVSLGWWAGDEIFRGVNPWRRLLGATVLAMFIVGHLSHW